jgi:hypothetical protein
MTKIQKLIEIFSAATYEVNYAAAKAKSTCLICNESARSFRDMSSRLEYRISALCQKCQDEYFSSKEVGETYERKGIDQ